MCHSPSFLTAGIYVAIKNNVDVEHLLIKYGLLKGELLPARLWLRCFPATGLISGVP